MNPAISLPGIVAAFATRQNVEPEILVGDPPQESERRKIDEWVVDHHKMQQMKTGG